MIKNIYINNKLSLLVSLLFHVGEFITRVIVSGLDFFQLLRRRFALRRLGLQLGLELLHGLLQLLAMSLCGSKYNIKKSLRDNNWKLPILSVRRGSSSWRGLASSSWPRISLHFFSTVDLDDSDNSSATRLPKMSVISADCSPDGSAADFSSTSDILRPVFSCADQNLTDKFTPAW